MITRSMRWFVVWVMLPALIALVAFVTFWQGRALGAYGDDSAGYIYLAGRLFHHQPLMFVSDVGKQAIDFFQDEKLARWAIPTHHQYINPSGMAASKYPLLLSILMTVGGMLIHSPRGFFIIQPLSSVGILVGVYFFVLLAFHSYRHRVWLALGSACALYLAPLFFESTLSQPMRELPAMCFLIWAFVAMSCFARMRVVWKRLLALSVSAVLFGFAVDVRETLIVILPALMCYYIFFRSEHSHFLRDATIFFVTFVIACAPIIYTSVSISAHKVAFKKRDTGSVVILPNIGHVESFSIQNIFHNDGKFKPGEGSLPTYVNTMATALPVGMFGFFVLYGAFRLLQRERKLGLVLILWAVPILMLYALWVNPYGRYILPLYPAMMICAAYGVLSVLTYDIPVISNSMRARRLMQCILVCGFVAYLAQPVSTQLSAARNVNARTDREFVRADVNALYALDALMTAVPGKTLLIFTGKNQAGVSEVYDAYTGHTSMRFAMDQKYPTTLDATRKFFAEHVFPEYTVLAIVDSSTSADFYQWAAEYTLETIGSVPFTFQLGTRLVRVTQ